MTDLRPPTRPVRPAPGGAGVAVPMLAVLAVLATGIVVPAAGAAGVTAGPARSVTGPEVADADSSLSVARAQRVAAAAALADATAARTAAEARAEDLGRRDAQVTSELARVRRQVREYVVAAYIDGGRTETYLSTLPPDDAGALAWRTGLVAGSTVSQGRAVERFRELRAETAPARVAAATDLDRARDAEDRAGSAFLQASAPERDAEVALAAARRAAAERAAAERAAARAAAERAQAEATVSPATVVAPSGAAPAPRRPVGPPSAGGGGIADATPAELALLAKIRRCESGGNYSVVSASGRYRGAYQFSVSTWQAMGGTGDPAAASPAEQDLRALMLLRRQGPRAWPVCSR